MARPREFDEDVVLDKALELFWAQGYAATSIDDLVRATGLGRASLYGAFGDKDHLFRRILERYRSRSRAQFEPLLALPSGREALEAFFALALENGCTRSSSCSTVGRGCLATLTATLPEPVDPEARAIVADMFDASETLLRTLVERAQAAGELTRAQPPEAIARLLMVTSQGLATAARAGRTLAELREIASQTLDLLAPRNL